MKKKMDPSVYRACLYSAGKEHKLKSTGAVATKGFRSKTLYSTQYEEGSLFVDEFDSLFKHKQVPIGA